MSQTQTLPALAQGEALHLSDVDWRTYGQFLRLFEERPGYRLTYDQGELEIMSPTLIHDNSGRLLGYFVGILAEESGPDFFPGGSTTLRRKLKQKGLEADECYWIANAHRMRGKKRLNLRTDPPPDLAIEVDVTRSSMNRMGIYAALNVPEVWRLRGDKLRFLALKKGRTYRSISASLSFPLVSPGDLLAFLQKAREQVLLVSVLREFRAWYRQRLEEGGEAE